MSNTYKLIAAIVASLSAAVAAFGIAYGLRGQGTEQPVETIVVDTDVTAVQDPAPVTTPPAVESTPNATEVKSTDAAVQSSPSTGAQTSN